MTGDEYQKLSERTLDEDPSIAIMALGLTGEAGEVADIIKKHIGHGYALDKEKLLLELGDVQFYIAAMCTACGFSLDEVMRANVHKLAIRYPNGFVPGGGNRDGK